MSNKERLAPVMEPPSEEQSQAEKLAKLDYELQAEKIKAGEKENTYGIWGPIWKVLRYFDSFKGKHRFKKKTYLLFMLFTGFIGGHRYYQGRWKLGLIYTLFFWTGVPLALCITDAMEALPIQADEEGYIVL